MAHTCPDCGVKCHCCGDIDDLVFGVEYGCVHCETDGDRDENDDDDWEDED